MRIAVTTPYYVPAVRAGGPVPGIQGVVATLTDHDVHIFTRDKDLGDALPFEPPYRGTVSIEGSRVTYLSTQILKNVGAWVRALRTLRSADVVYVNSLFSAPFTIMPVLVLWATRYSGTVVISPRGELATVALHQGKGFLKRIWLSLIRTLGMDRSIGRRNNVVWLASAAPEAADFKRVFRLPWVAICPESLRPWPGPAVRFSENPEKAFRVLSVGRITPIKGTIDLVRAAGHVRIPLRLTLIGLAEDPAYVKAVRSAAAEVPKHVEVEIVGPRRPEQIRAAALESDLFALLTQGESFGHAIGEALQCGLPVLISDQTPWSFVATENAGIVIPAGKLSDAEYVAGKLDQLANESHASRNLRSQAALNCAQQGITVAGQQTLLEAVAARNGSHNQQADGPEDSEHKGK